MPEATAAQTVLGLIQMRMSADPEENLTRAIARIRDAAGRGANVICLPELFRSPYFCQTEDHAFFALAESIPGPTTARLAGLAGELGVVIIASLFEKRAEGLYHNTTAILDADGQYLGKYRKMHIPDDPNYYEKFYFTPGDLGYRSWPTRHAKAGVLICWDQWYPEAARLTALTGAQILFYPTAIGWLVPEKAEYGTAQQQSWETIQRSHAIANGVFVAAVNRVGLEAGPNAGIEFWGGSFVCAPNGEIIAKAGTAEETLLVPVDLTRVDFARTHWPFLRDRRVDSYGELTKRYID
ncbi:MAG: carbon-nitrogen hydrolase [Gemmatimonadales bacterium]